MPVPPQIQQALQRRYNVEWTRGGYANSTPVGIHLATSQDIGGPPTAPQLAGSDTTTFTQSMSSNLAANATQTLTIPISFSGIPTLTVPLGFSLVAQPSVNANTSIAGLNIASTSLIVTALARGRGQTQGPVFSSQATYSGFGGYVAVQLTNSSGATITAGTIYGSAVLQLWLYNRDVTAASNVAPAQGSDAPVSSGSPSGNQPPQPPNPPGVPTLPGGGRGPTRW